SITYQFNVFQEIDPWLDKYNELENRFGKTKKIDVQLKLTISMLNALVHRSPESHAMEKWTQKGWQLLLQIKDVNSTFQIFVPIIILKIMQGDHPAAAHLIQMFDRVSEEKTTPLPFLMLQELKSFHFWLTGDFEKGLAAARYGMAMEKKTGIYLIFSGLRIQGAASAMGLQKYDLAEEFLSQITPLLNRQGLWQQGLYHFICAWYHVLGHNLPKARFHALSCLEKGKATGNRMILSICHLMAAKIQFAFEEKESSDQHIEKALSLAYTYKMTQTRFMALLARAFFLFSENRDKYRNKDRDKDKDKEAVNALAQAMTMGRQWNYKYGFTWDNREMIFLCTRALKRNIEVPYVQTLIRETGLFPGTPPLDIHTWPWMCEITTLGTFTIKVQGKPLIFSKKSRQRPLTLLKYLISKKGRNVPEHAIQDAIWPESEGDMAENAYTTTLHRLRHLLGSRQAVIRSHGLVSLNASFTWTDINAFEACCQKIEKLLSPENAPAMGSDEKKAPDEKRETDEQSRQEALVSALNALIRLYGGPFLPGEDVSWIFASRAHFRIRFSEMLLKAGRVFERHKHLETAVCFYRQGIDADERLEPLYPELMQAYIQLKQNNQALCLFREYQAVFQKEQSSPLSLKMTQLKHQCISS
ncbi:MAG: BTAD domain-containing putative transcriptional regulator, partial [Desulfobacteraceae bacterium]